jgi:hypothetical protein
MLRAISTLSSTIWLRSWRFSASSVVAATRVEQLGGPGGALVLGQPLCAGSDIERVNIGRHRATPVL